MGDLEIEVPNGESHTCIRLQRCPRYPGDSLLWGMKDVFEQNMGEGLAIGDLCLKIPHADCIKTLLSVAGFSSKSKSRERDALA